MTSPNSNVVQAFGDTHKPSRQRIEIKDVTGKNVSAYLIDPESGFASIPILGNGNFGLVNMDSGLEDVKDYYYVPSLNTVIGIPKADK